ncbi:MAG: hypothetical protein R3F18_01885 [Lysobacterales bacterium]
MVIAAHPVSWNRRLTTFMASLLILFAAAPALTQDAFQPSGLPPALLPNKAQVAPGAPSAIDGIWTISTLGKRIRIEAGRAYAVDAWAHLGLLEVQPDMVVIQNIQRVDQGRYGGEDLPLLGRLSAQLQPGAMDVSVAGAFGPVRYQLIAVQLDDPDAYQRELGASLPAPPPGVTPWPTPNPPPGITPAPPPKPRPNPRPSPSPRGCGGIGEQPCEIVPAQYVGKAEKLGCPGKQSYFSSIRGGSCWTCPKDYRRSSPTRKMDHPKACIKRGSLTGPWKPARYTQQAWGCPSGQFHVALGGGSCMRCPAHTTRIQVAGVDAMKCKPDYRCAGNLRVAKQPPENNPLANLIGASSAKVCAPPFDLKAAARGDQAGFSVFGTYMTQLAQTLVKDIKADRQGNLKQLIKAKRWRDVYALLREMPAYRALEGTAREAGKHSITVGWSGDFQLIAGVNGEAGIAIDLVERKVKPYESAGISKGIAAGIDSALTVGIWNGPFETGYSQGVAASVSGAVSVGGAIWYSYYSPDQGQEHLLGVTASVGLGLGIEFGEYNEVGTFLLQEVFDQY